ncbi:MAG: glycosyltransferase [Microcoleaceae cyanobacterium]
MKITIIAMEIPYPPIHGGRVDIWRRIKALAKQGTELQLICWSRETPDVESLAVIEKYVQKFYLISYERTFTAMFQRAIDLLSYPLEVTSRILKGKKWDDLLNAVRTFKPDVIIADHVHCGIVALPLSQELNVPMIVRSHDVEHLHYRYLLKLARGHRKVLRLLSINHLERYEKSILGQSLAFYDISADDLKFWESQGFTNGHFLPPLIEFQEESTNDCSSQDHSTEIQPIYDMVFLGNLRTENNIAGLVWLVEEVLPILKAQLPSIKLLIAGSYPTSIVQKLVQETEGVDLSVNPALAIEVYKLGHVLVNPVATGSGVSVKSIDMLVAGKPIVTLPKGLYGLPEEAKQCFRVATDAQSFAEEVIECLTEDSPQIPDLSLLDSLFGDSVIENFLVNLNSMISV